MSFSRKAAILCALCLGITAGASAQFMQRGPHAPSMPTPLKPEVGAGAQYQVTKEGRNVKFTYAVVGKEKVEGNEGYWLEIRTESARTNGEMIIKELAVNSGSHPQIKRLIIQQPGRSPMEMPASMLSMMEQHTQPGSEAGNGSPGEKIGTESVTVPAGTFECEHYRKQENGKTIDYWVSAKVSPYGLVKMTGEGTSMMLEKLLTGQTSHIKGKPQQMQMPHY